MTVVEERFGSMGAEARVVLDSNSLTRAELERHAAAVRETFERVEGVLSRFRADSELCALNADPRLRVPASPLMRRFVDAARWAAGRSSGPAGERSPTPHRPSAPADERSGPRHPARPAREPLWARPGDRS